MSHYFQFHYNFENITHECIVSRGMKHQYENMLVVVLFLNPVPIKTIRFWLQAVQTRVRNVRKEATFKNERLVSETNRFLIL